MKNLSLFKSIYRFFNPWEVKAENIEAFWNARPKITKIRVEFEDGQVREIDHLEADRWAKLNYYVINGFTSKHEELKEINWVDKK